MHASRDGEPAATASWQTKRWRKWGHRIAWAVAITVVVGPCVAAIPAIRRAQHAAQTSQCTGHLKYLGLAMLNYQDARGFFPPAYLADNAGRPTHSWRVLLLPYMEGLSFYKEYRFSEPWNSPFNLQLEREKGATYRNAYRCPSQTRNEDCPTANYVVVVDPETAFPGARSRSLADVRDGLSNTIFIVEYADSDIHWMEPRDLDLAEMSLKLNDPDRPSISTKDLGGPIVAFGDDSVRRIPDSVSPATLRALLTANGGEPIDKRDPFRDVVVRSTPPPAEKK